MNVHFILHGAARTGVARLVHSFFHSKNLNFNLSVEQKRSKKKRFFKTTQNDKYLSVFSNLLSLFLVVGLHMPLKCASIRIPCHHSFHIHSHQFDNLFICVVFFIVHLSRQAILNNG